MSQFTDDQKWEIMQLIQKTNVHTEPSLQTLEMFKQIETKLVRVIEIVEKLLSKTR